MFWLANNQVMKNKVSRKNFLAWSFGISYLLAIPAFLKFSNKKENKSTTVKMLTQDGKLVEIDVANIHEKKKKIKATEIQTWVNRKTAL